VEAGHGWQAHQTNRVLPLQLQAGPTPRAECNLAQISEKDLDRLGLGAFNFVDVISSPSQAPNNAPKIQHVDKRGYSWLPACVANS
jgi:hypothetical protein